MKKVLTITAISIFVAFVIIVIPLVIGFARTGDRTTVAGRDYSLLNKQEIITRLQNDFVLPPSVVLTYQNRSFHINTASISASYNHQDLASDLLFRRLNQGFVNYLRAFLQPRSFTLILSYDSSALNSQIEAISSQIDRPFVPSEIILDGPTPIVKPGELGLTVNRPSLSQVVVTSLTNYSLDPISISTEVVGDLPTEDQIQSALSKSRPLTSKTLQLKYLDNHVSLDSKTLISWVGFGTPCQLPKVREYVDALASSIHRGPIDAVFKFENGKVLDFQPSRDGYSLLVDEAIDLICRQFDTTQAIDLPLTFSKPKITTDSVNNLGIKELLGRGTSSFSHSSAIRNFNVEKGASIVNRILVAPGEEFSFIKSLGDVSLEAGYKKAYVIKQGRTELDVGGGICQVSTTFFRAILNAGLDIRERKAHAYRVSYYEEDTKPGFDATVFIPSPDLKFINDTGNYLLIQSQYDGQNKKLTYEIYGTSDGRIADINNYRQWDYAPPPPDVYIDDPTLPPGKVVKDESRVPGLKTAFDWKVTRSGQVIHQKTFQSNYVPWAAVYRRGPQI